MNKELEEIYNSLPAINCKGKCYESCGPIAMHQVEAGAIIRAGYKLPTYGNPLGGPITCSALMLNRKCAIYEHRPLICRLWGIAEGMPCTFGCVPDRVLTNREAAHLLKRLNELSKGQIVEPRSTYGEAGR